MENSDFKTFAKELVDFTIEYQENIRDRPVLPDVQPSYMRELLPDTAPENSDDWKVVLRDVERIILPGMTNWNSPHFHAYYQLGNSYPSMCAEILESGLSCLGFSWMASPACTELEMVMMDWLGKMLNLPEEFLFESGGLGGGVIQGSTCEGTFLALLAARNHMLSLVENATAEKLVAYASDQSHSSVERAALLGAVKFRHLPTDENLSLRGEVLSKAIEEDRKKGDIPFVVIGTLGTTSSCAFDNIKEIGRVCAKEELWLHIDAAYAGSAFICPEFRHLLEGIEYADSFSFNPHKWLLVNFDCSAMWVKNRLKITEPFAVDTNCATKHEGAGQVPDYMHWQIPTGRRFRSLKLWFVIRMYGVEGLRKHIRKHVRLAKEFESLVVSDPQFEVVAHVILGLVCFKLKGPDSLNQTLLKMLNDRRKIHLIAASIRGEFILRFSINSRFTSSEDVAFAFSEIQEVAGLVKLETVQPVSELIRSSKILL